MSVNDYNIDGNNNTVNIADNNNNYNIDNTIHIIPCLKERRQQFYASNELEQEQTNPKRTKINVTENNFIKRVLV